MKIMVFDPGENTGWVAANIEVATKSVDNLIGGTSVRDHTDIVRLFDTYNPDFVVYESFRMYPGLAKELSWNKFYPCEVIGVIKVTCSMRNIPFIEQSPSIKKYSGGLDQRWVDLREKVATTEHCKDAYLHLKYFLRNNLHKAADLGLQ